MCHHLVKCLGLAVAMLALQGLAACGGGGGADDPVVCVPISRPGVVVFLTDAGTGAPIEGATITLTEGTYEATVQAGDPGIYAGAFNRAGVYELIAEAPNYQTAYRSDIVVLDRGACDVVTATVDVELEPK